MMEKKKNIMMLFGSIHTFSPDSKRFAYDAQIKNKGFVVIDGKEKQYDGIASILIFSPDSNHVAYVAKSGNNLFVVVDGKEEKQYDDIGSDLIFSPDRQSCGISGPIREEAVCSR